MLCPSWSFKAGKTLYKMCTQHPIGDCGMRRSHSFVKGLRDSYLYLKDLSPPTLQHMRRVRFLVGRGPSRCCVEQPMLNISPSVTTVVRRFTICSDGSDEMLHGSNLTGESCSLLAWRSTKPASSVT